MRLSPLVPLAALIFSLLSGAVPPLSSYNVHEKRTTLPSSWRLVERYKATSTIPLQLALKQKNINDIGTYLHDVSHPTSPNYGKHWSAGDIVRKFAPTDETIAVVRNWLLSNDIDEHRISLSRTKGWMRVNVTVEEAERLMNTEYNVYIHTSGKLHVGCELYHLPVHVQPHVDFVTPSVHFDTKLTRQSSDDSGASALARGIGQPGRSASYIKDAGLVSGATNGLKECDKYITPICLRTLYGLFYKPISTDKNSYGIAEYSPQAYLPNDLQMFARNYSVDLIGKEPHLVSIDGGYLQTVNQSITYNGESDLDLQYDMSLVTGSQTVTLYQTGDMAGNALFNNFLDAIDGSYCSFDSGDDPTQDGIYPDLQLGGYRGPEACGTVEPTYIISTLYSGDEIQVTPFYAERQCTEYAKLGLMGITILYSTGDYGVAGSNNTCLTPNGTEIAGARKFNPTFLATCPYITAVGATMVRPNTTVFEPEMACMDVIYSSGGFSNYFGIPDYQKDAVVHYLTHYPLHYPPTIWNSTGMFWAYPDISANGVNYVVAIDGKFHGVYGTSCSTPAVGAILMMINDARLVINKSTIGFINPTASGLRGIYSAEFAGAFHDITNGTNPGCGTAGFNVTAGWDPVTGLGTPNFPELLTRWLRVTLP